MNLARWANFIALLVNLVFLASDITRHFWWQAVVAFMGIIFSAFILRWLTATERRLADIRATITTSMAGTIPLYGSGIILFPFAPLESYPHITATKPIIGWRGWSLLRVGGNIYLNPVSQNQTQYWLPGVPYSAHNGSMGFNLKDLTHTHIGIHAFDTYAEHERELLSCYVWGEVYLWGDMMECTKGYRAEYAYPKRLWVNSFTKPLLERHTGLTLQEVAQDLQRTYGVEVTIGPPSTISP